MSNNKPRTSRLWLVLTSFMVLGLVLAACGPTQTGTGGDVETTTGDQATSPTAFPTTECGDIAGNQEGAEQVLEDTTSVPEEGATIAGDREGAEQVLEDTTSVPEEGGSVAEDEC